MGVECRAEKKGYSGASRVAPKPSQGPRSAVGVKMRLCRLQLVRDGGRLRRWGPGELPVMPRWFFALGSKEGVPERMALSRHDAG